jgi:hypothetical protein
MSDFSTTDLAARNFPTLFLYGYGDPYRNHARASEQSFLAKVRHLLLYGGAGKEDFQSRFAQHTRFVLWIFNVIYRHRAMSQAEIYLQQNPKDANLSVKQIQEMIDTKNTAAITKNFRRYLANIPRTPSYWYNVQANVKATIECKGPPQAFFTFSYADQ